MKIDVRRKIAANLGWFLRYPDHEVISNSLATLSRLSFGDRVELEVYATLVPSIVSILGMRTMPIQALVVVVNLTAM